MRHLLLTYILLGLSWTATDAGANAGDVLVAELSRIAETQKVTLGVSAVHVQSGRAISLNGDMSFPLASTYKVPMAAYALHLVEQGNLSMDQMIPVLPRDYVVSSQITQSFPHPGVSLSLMNIIEPTLIHSDNTATDVLLRTVGGGKAVTRWVESLGVKGLRVDRNTRELIADYLGVRDDLKEDQSFVEFMQAFMATHGEELPPEQSQAFYDNLVDDPRDHSTPKAMAQLLSGIWAGKILSDENTFFLKGVMQRCLTGTNRLSGKLPAFALPIAHKTGTIGGTVNDVGVIELPNGKGDVAIAVFTKGAAYDGPGEWEAPEAAIAETARAVYDYFLFSAD